MTKCKDRTKIFLTIILCLLFVTVGCAWAPVDLNSTYQYFAAQDPPPDEEDLFLDDGGDDG